IDPPVSDPNAATHSSAATAAADPPLDPPGTQCTFQGLRLGPTAEFSVEEPIANSSRFVFPSSTYPCARSLAITVASYGGTKFPSIRDAQVVRTPSVHILSLTATGIPIMGNVLRHPFNEASSALACLTAA